MCFSPKYGFTEPIRHKMIELLDVVEPEKSRRWWRIEKKADRTEIGVPVFQDEEALKRFKKMVESDPKMTFQKLKGGLISR